MVIWLLVAIEEQVISRLPKTVHQSSHLAFESGNTGVMGNPLHENSTGCFESE